MKTIYIVIVTWNGMKWIKCCLDSIQLSGYPCKTIVVDNGSTDETVSFIRNEFPLVEIIETGRNLGFGQANNLGIIHALENHADYVYLLNQDAYIYPDMFEKLIKAYEDSGTQAGILSPLHIQNDRRHLDCQFSAYLNTCSTNMIEDFCLNRLKPFYYVDSVPAAGWLLPKNTLQTIGGFDPLFFHYGEDHNYSQRANYHKLPTIVVPEAKMIHDRIGYGNEKMAKKKMFFRTAKTEIFMNINLGDFQILSSALKLWCKYFFESFRYIFKSPQIFCELQIAVPINFLFIGKYIAHRRRNKITGFSWLQKYDHRK